MPTEAQVLFQNICAHCHGSKGEGNPAIKAPSIAGLPEWYAVAQLENFRADRRGSHPQDTEGQLMRTISKVLTAAQTRLVAGYVSTLARVKHEPTLKNDVAEGRRLYEERCMECHRFNGEGELVFGAAPLAGLQDWYLAAQMRKFKNGMRGALKDDANGQKMLRSSGDIEDEKTLDSLAAYILTLSKEKPASAAEFGK